MATIFEKDTVTIQQSKYEELIRTSEKYNCLYRIVYSKFKDLFADIADQLEAIDFVKFNEIHKNKEEIK